MWPFSKPAPKCSTGRVIDPMELRALGAGHIGDSAYSEVNSAWLKSYYDSFRKSLFREGVVRWDERFDCNHFSSYYIALAQVRNFTENFHTKTRAQSLAIGECWFMQTPITAHAVVMAVADAGVLYIEPQTGQQLTLSTAQIASRFLVKF